MKRFRDGEFRTQREEPKNPKSKNLFWARNLSPKKLGLDTLKIVSRLFSLFSFFLSFFFLSQIKVRQRLYA